MTNDLANDSPILNGPIVNESTQTEVNKEAMREWVAALRSGKYAQGESYLARRIGDEDARYCCLGVACEIFAERLDVPRDETVSMDGSVVVTYGGHTQWLPLSVRKLLGTDSEPNGKIFDRMGNFNTVSVVTMNDSGQYTFDEIANALEWAYSLGEEDNSDTA